MDRNEIDSVVDRLMEQPRRDRFAPRSGCYKCRDCGKLTRDTGHGEGSVRLCRKCYELAGWENIHSDKGHDEPGKSDPRCPICHELGYFSEE